MAQSPPNTLGKYQIIREIARSNDIVYEGWDPVMNRRVAVKELAMPGGASQQQKDDRIKRFMREAKAAGSLSHPNIMTVYEVGQEGERYFIAMEYLDGKNLRAEIESKGFLPPERAVEIAKAMLSGLGFAHEHGVIHRDVKPDNIQILDNGQIKITDFGIARLTFEPNLTMDGQVFGTPSYMSPEQINGKEIDARSDLFSVGVLLFEMVSGRKPFTGDNVVAITYSIMNSQPNQPQQCSAGLWEVIRKSVEKTPNMRYANAAQMMDGLKMAQLSNQPDPHAGYGQPGQPWTTGNQSVSPHQPQPPYIGGQIVQPNSNAPINPYAPPVLTNPLQPPASLIGHTHQQPYGQPTSVPYGQPTTVPYGQPQTQAYGQYGQTYVPGYGQTQYAPYSQQPVTPVPVYYPPPPRQPLFKAETTELLANMFKAFVVLGLIAAILIFLINAVTSNGAKSGARSADRVSAPQTDAAAGSEDVTIGDRSAATQSSKTEPPKGPLQDQVGGAILVPTDKPVSSAVAEGDIATAKATIVSAATEDFDAKRNELYTQADDMFAKAIKGDPAKREEYNREAFLSYVDIARGFIDNQNIDATKKFQRAQEAHNHALSYIDGNPKSQQESDNLDLEIRAGEISS